MRLIDADALKEEIKFQQELILETENSWVAGYVTGLSVAAEDVEIAPTINAVSVVRCKDCQYYQRSDWFDDDDPPMCKCWGDWLPTNENDFCSNGVRKEDGVLPH